MMKLHTNILKQSISNRIMRPVLFDVSLRDGIQGANPNFYDTQTKKGLFDQIRNKYIPAKMEIGSFVSPKVLPIMSDTPEMFDYAIKTARQEDTFSPDIYALVPNKKGLLDAIRHGVRNFSFITSVSNEFQVKNTRRDLDFKKTELQEMMALVASINGVCKTKLYVSCINECPISGLIDSDYVIYEILSEYGLAEFEDGFTLDEICLSDTMGTLKTRDFEYIVDGLLRFGLPTSRISLHLHVGKDNELDAKRILFACFRRGIHQFDVSYVGEGGCSVSMDRANLKPNMTYEFFRSTLDDYNRDL